MKAQPSTLVKPADQQEKWYLVDAAGLVVGRLAARVAKLLRGKTLPTYAPHLDPKIHVIITNADKIVFTGDKQKTKTYYWHSGWNTGEKSVTVDELLRTKPERILEQAIHGMLPKTRLGKRFDAHLRIYKSGDYKGQHDAQKPETLVIKTRTPKAKA